MNLLSQTYFENSIQDYLIALIIVIAGISLIKLLRQILKKKLSSIDNAYIKYFLGMEAYAYPVFLLLVINAALNWLTLPAKVTTFLHYVFTVAFVLLLIRLISAAVRTAIRSYLVEQDETGGKLKQVRGIILILNGILWTIGLIFLFDNLGFNVTAVLTGLGVGGIAIALAAQTILGDLFNYFVIFFDRPFELGDFIVVDDKLGTVEYIGIKTTRIKSLQGEQVVFSNSNLTNSRIHNYKKMLERRVLFKLGIVYDTGRQKLEKIPQMIKSIIEAQDDTRFDRAHFSGFGDFSLTIEVVYYVLSPDYNRYMDIHERINLSIHESFAQNEIEFAFPTYTIAIQNSKTHNGNKIDPPCFNHQQRWISIANFQCESFYLQSLNILY